MLIRFPCPTCQRVLRVDDQFAGRTSKCPGCATAVIVPAPFAANEGFTPVVEQPTPVAITAAPPPPPPVVDDPLAFHANSGDDDWVSAAGTGALSADWRSVRSGLQLIRLGTIVNICTLVAMIVGMIILALTGAALLTQLLQTTSPNRPPIGRGDVRTPEAIDDAGALVFGLVLVFGLIVVSGSLIAAGLRIVGFFRCTKVPTESGAQGSAIGALVCELVPLLGYAIVFFSVLVVPGFSRVGQAVNGLAGLAGLICLLLFLRQVGVALGSKQLPERVLNYVIWIAISIASSVALVCLTVTLVFALGFGIAASRRSGDAAVGMGMVAMLIMFLFLAAYVTIAIILLVKYLGLLQLAHDEIGRRAGKGA